MYTLAWFFSPSELMREESGIARKLDQMFLYCGNSANNLKLHSGHSIANVSNLSLSWGDKNLPKNGTKYLQNRTVPDEDAQPIPVFLRSHELETVPNELAIARVESSSLSGN